MKPPRTVKVGAYPFSVVYDPAISDDGEVGQMIPRTQTIKLLPGQGFIYEKDTVLHEVIHASMFTTNLKKMSNWDDTVEEAVILAISPVLLQVARENPRLIQYLVEK